MYFICFSIGRSELSGCNNVLNGIDGISSKCDVASPDLGVGHWLMLVGLSFSYQTSGNIKKELPLRIFLRMTLHRQCYKVDLPWDLARARIMRFRRVIVHFKAGAHGSQGDKFQADRVNPWEVVAVRVSGPVPCPGQ